MNESNLTSSVRDSVEELSASALFALDGEGSQVELPAPEPGEHTETLTRGPSVAQPEPAAPAATAYVESAGDDPTVKRAPDWPAIDDADEVDAEEQTKRRPSSLPPPPRVPFQSAPVVERPFNRAPWLTTPRLPPPPRVPGFVRPVNGRLPLSALPQVRRALPRPSPPPPRPPSTPPVRMFPSPREEWTAPTREHVLERPRPSPHSPAREPEPPRALDSQPSWHDDSRTARTSLLPLTRSVSAVTREISQRPLPFIAGAAVGLAVFLVTFLLVAPSNGRASAHGEPDLFVTVGGPGSTALAEPSVFVDGVLRCSAAPCRVSALATGLHFVTVSAEGHSPSAPRVVRVTDDQPALLHVELEPVPKPEHVAVAPVQASPPVVEPAPAAPAERTAPPPTRTASRVVPVPTPKPAPIPVKATLNLNSIPIANVVLDGRPLGSTPKLGLSVAAGEHTVVFVHPDLGRRVQTVDVSPGTRQTVGVRF